MTKSRGIFQIVIHAQHFAQMLRRDYSLKKKYAGHANIQDGDHVFKMADMSGKEIIKFAKNVPTCPIGMTMVSNHIVWSM